MNHNQLIQNYESKYLKEKTPTFQIGDTIKVHNRIVEGQKERVQVFTGTVIARKGSGLSESFTVYRNAYGSSMERLFLLNSPKIAKIEVIRKGKVRRAKLNYIRGESGKAAKIKERQTRTRKEKVSKAEPTKVDNNTQTEASTSEE